MLGRLSSATSVSQYTKFVYALLHIGRARNHGAQVNLAQLLIQCNGASGVPLLVSKLHDERCG